MRDIRTQLNIFNIIENIKEYKIKWEEHVERMDENVLPVRIRFQKCSGKRNTGRPRKRWAPKQAKCPNKSQLFSINKILDYFIYTGAKSKITLFYFNKLTYSISITDFRNKTIETFLLILISHIYGLIPKVKKKKKFPPTLLFRFELRRPFN